MDCNTIRNEYRILHDGASQSARAPFALHPDYVQVDERGDADRIVFTREYARFLQFYDQNNLPAGDWQPFWSNNPAIVLAALSTARPDWFREETRLLFIELQKLDNQANEPLLKQNFNRLFDAIATLSKTLDQQTAKLPDALNIKFSLKNLIKGKLGPAFKQWIAWYKQANDATPPFPLLDAGQNLLPERVQQMKILGESPSAMSAVLNHPFSAEWITDNSPDWNTYVGNILPDATVFGSAPMVTDAAGHINFAIRHFFFTNVYETFLKGYSKAAQESEAALQELLQHWNLHEPHFALYLSFLRLLNQEKTYLNTLTERHLRFYYERVLRLKPKAPEPAHAHLLVTLGKHISAHLLPQNIEFKAGKDASGQEIRFALDQDFVANKATIAELKCIFKAPLDPALYQFNPELPAYRNTDINRYFAAPVANSEDGNGAELLNDQKQWRPFGNKTASADNHFWDIAIPKAEVGFAIASNYLFLRDGTRTITLTFNGLANGVLNGKTFRLYLTTAKKWYEAEATVASNKLIIEIGGDVPAIEPWSEKVHGGGFNTGDPVLKAVLVNETSTPYGYEDLKNLTLTGINLQVDVENKQTLALSGPTGALDGSKPFHPFGPAPENGAVFHIGDKEVFQKTATCTLHVEWKEQYVPYGSGGSYFHEHTSNIHPYSSFLRLQKGKWGASASPGELLAINTISPTATFTLGAADLIEPDYSANRFFQAGDTAGFVRFKLNGDWGHAIYAKALAQYISSKPSGAADPLRLYDPQILSISLDYTADTLIPLQNTDQYNGQQSRFFQLHPFGQELITPANSASRLMPLLAPQHDSGGENNIGKDAGEWFIGVKDLVAPQVLSILIQVADGSADPLAEKPDNHLQWAWLKGNTWTAFEPDEVVDGTNGLLQSGLVLLSLPREADTAHSILTDGLHWLRVSVESAVDSVCRIIGVHAQGIAVTLADNHNDPQLNALPLPAGSIAKLVNADTAVKKIEQPYATFGGRPAENGEQFFTRVSERLRHKNRAITLWDYERMVLEAFPSAHKVKCLNHLRFEPQGNTNIYRELAPGHVTVIVVSNLRNRNAVNPLRPYTSLGELKNIEAFLKKHMSCLAHLHVRNPLFEPVKAEFKVRFFPGYDEQFYQKLLNDEIIRFLSPWAFDGGQDIGFGGKIYKSALINFVEEQPYVDYVEDFKLIHQTVPPQPDQETIEASTLCSILVSAEQHDITIIKSGPVPGLKEDCGCGESAAVAGQPELKRLTATKISASKKDCGCG